MQSQKLCLKWNNHTPNLLSVLGSFQQKELLVDVTISCEGHNVKAHKIVLSACSPYFQEIFLNNPCKHPIIFMNGMKYEDISAILNFMYKGEVNVSHDGLSSFLQAAEALKVKGLAEVCGEKNSTNSISQEVQQSEQSRPPRTDTPPRKRQRNRKRSLSDSNRSDDEGSTRKQHREPSSPEVHELSGDESLTGDNSSNGTPFNSMPRVPQKAFSRSHQPSSNLGDEDDYEMDADKLLEQNMATETTSMNNSTDNNLRIERIMGNATEMESSSLQEPESPPDIKPIINFGESSTGASEGALMSYNEQSQFSQPGPSSAQDSTLLHDSSHTTEYSKYEKISSNKLVMAADIFPVKTENIESHELVHPCGCMLCGSLFENQDILDQHLKTHFQASYEPIEESPAESKKQEPQIIIFPHKCMFCGERFETQEVLGIHKKIHLGKGFFCCKKYCRSLSALENHKKSMHSNMESDQEIFPAENSHACSYCNENFDYQYLLINHLKFCHSMEFICLGCKEHFISTCSLKDHQKCTLSSLKCRLQALRNISENKCGFCEVKLESQAILEKHIQTYHPEIITCLICNEYFTSKSARKMHNKCFHGL